ncbi:MAG: hypothetical protein ACKO7W_06255 [Elainella sp.]
MVKLLPRSITEARAARYRNRSETKAEALLKRQAAGGFLDRRERRAVQQYLAGQRNAAA